MLRHVPILGTRQSEPSTVSDSDPDPSDNVAILHRNGVYLFRLTFFVHSRGQVSAGSTQKKAEQNDRYFCPPGHELVPSYLIPVTPKPVPSDASK
jgi:hypothetical protein